MDIYKSGMDNFAAFTPGKIALDKGAFAPGEDHLRLGGRLQT